MPRMSHTAWQRLSYDDWKREKNLNIEDVIDAIAKRRDKMTSALSKLIKNIDNHSSRLMEISKTFMAEKALELENMCSNGESLPNDILLPKLVYTPSAFERLPLFLPGSLAVVEPPKPDSTTGIVSELSSNAMLDFIQIDFSNLSVGSPSLDSWDSVSARSDVTSDTEVHSTVVPGTDTQDDPTLCHLLVASSLLKDIPVNDFVFSSPARSFLASHTKGLFMKEDEKEWKNISSNPCTKLCLAENWLFVNGGYGNNKIRRFDLLSDKLGGGPKEGKSIEVRGGRWLLGMAYSPDRLLAICDAISDRVTIHHIDDGAQVDVIKDPELFFGLQVVEAVWLDSDKLCVLLRKLPDVEEWTVCCLSLKYKELLWKSQPYPWCWYISSAYDRVYVPSRIGPTLSVMSGTTGEVMGEIRTPNGGPFRVFGRDNKINVCSLTSEP